MVAQFHGHVHNFLVSKLYSYSTGSAVQYDAWRIGTPNAQYNRENYYTTVGSYTGISFAEEVSYNKTANSAKDTSFVVNVVNPSEQKIYSYCYGAGYDRVIGYASIVYYSVATSLTNVTINNTATSIEENQSYTATLSIPDKYEWGTVKITMGGTDVTSSVYSNGKINISKVTGNIVITATATKIVYYINQIPISTNASGAQLNANGWVDNTYLSGGAESYNWGFECTGYIPCKKGDTIRLRDVGFSKSTNSGTCRIAYYDANRTYLGMVNGGSTYNSSAVTDANGNWTQFTVPSTITGPSGSNVTVTNMAFFRMCANEITANSVITVNQEIID